MGDNRPSPEEFLAKIKEEELEGEIGKLKIFLGYAPGVGKTYAMLDAAHEAKEHGIDVVVGYVEPHRRPETAAMLEGLEQIPPRIIEYKGKSFEELDTDAVLERKPELVLIDELAHTNVPTMRHLKRYGDVEELLAKGIHVYTTVNIQHIESLHDLVEDITGVKVRERIPDYLIDRATQLQLVDIEPDELIQRMKQGKIYSLDRAETAIDFFFKKQNLEALREIALRRTADTLYHQKTEKQASVGKGFHVEEHILVGISNSPTNAKVIRTAARLAHALPGKFTGLYVQNMKKNYDDEIDKERLQKNIQLTEQLGGRIVIVQENDVAAALANYAQISGVTKLVIGRTALKSKWRPFASKISDSFTEFVPNIAIHVVPDEEKEPLRIPDLHFQVTFEWIDVIKMFVVFGLASLVGLFFLNFGISESNIIMIYILGVLLLATWTSGWLMSLISSLSAVLIFNFFFTEPRFSFTANRHDYPITFLIMFLSGFITSSLTKKIKAQATIAVRKAYRTEVLLETNRKLQCAKSYQEIITEGMEQIVKLVEMPAEFFEISNNLITRSDFFKSNKLTRVENEKSAILFANPSELGVATWVANNKQPAGRSTDIFSAANAYYVPVLSGSDVRGVVGIVLPYEGAFPAFERNILLAIINDFSFALDKWHLQRVNEEVAREAELEQMRANLLRAISHDLRTPLTSISGNADILLTNGDLLSVTEKSQLYQDIYSNSKWLVQMVENLLAVSRLENGELGIEIQPEIVADIIQEAISHVTVLGKTHDISYEVEPEFVMAKMDARLIIQVLINLIDNAVTYTPAGSEIFLTVIEQENTVLFSIKDNGPGIDESLKAKLFEPFATGKNQRSDSRRGLGLGLALCQTILNLHGSELTLQDNEPSGAIFNFSLEKGDVIIHEETNLGG